MRRWKVEPVPGLLFRMGFNPKYLFRVVSVEAVRNGQRVTWEKVGAPPDWGTRSCGMHYWRNRMGRIPA